MDRSRLVGGIICLVIAGFLAVLNLTLAPENLMFQVGDQNMPWIPPIVLGIIGVVLTATAAAGSGRRAMEGAAAAESAVTDPDRAALNKRLEGMAWGLFLIMLGGFMFVPEEIIKGGWWSIGVGLIMLGLNAARYFNGLKMSGFTTFLGVLSVIGGTLEVFGFYEVDGAVFLIILGAYLLLKPYFDKRKLFGKAEQA
jgi:hypothetical protein